MSTITTSLRSQYSAALSMMEQCVRECPETKWHDASDANRFWQVSYHALIYVAFYLSSEEAPVFWDKYRPDYQWLSRENWPLDFDANPSAIYTQEEILELIQWLQTRLDDCFEDSSFDSPSGFSWLPFSRFETYLYNLRHLQHHTGQLSSRIKQSTGTGVNWLGYGKKYGDYA